LPLAARSTIPVQLAALRSLLDGASLVELEKDYAAMREDRLLALSSMTFAEILEHCPGIKDAVNRLTLRSRPFPHWTAHPMNAVPSD
jgi:hypothetical protein